MEETTRQQLYTKLKNIAKDYRESKKQENALISENKKKSNEIKSILEELELDNFQDEDLKVSITVIDKSYLDETPLLKYLKDNNLEKYIRTKEYFEPDDLIIASNNGELNLEDIAKFKIEKTEKRLNVK